MDAETPTVTRIKNGWHAGSRRLNLTVRGATEKEARELFAEAATKAAELRRRPDPPWGKDEDKMGYS